MRGVLAHLGMKHGVCNAINFVHVGVNDKDYKIRLIASVVSYCSWEASHVRIGRCEELAWVAEGIPSDLS